MPSLFIFLLKLCHQSKLVKWQRIQLICTTFQSTLWKSAPKKQILLSLQMSVIKFHLNEPAANFTVVWQMHNQYHLFPSVWRFPCFRFLRHRVFFRFQGIVEAFASLNKLFVPPCVGYFDQPLSAAHSKHWLKSAFSMFFAKNLKNLQR